MNRQTENRFCAALVEHGIGRFVVVNLIRSHGRQAAAILHQGGEDQAINHLLKYERRARENMPRMRRRNRAEYLRLAAMVHQDNRQD